MVERQGESVDDRNHRFDRFLERHARGWERHTLRRRQRNIVVQTSGSKPRLMSTARTASSWPVNGLHPITLWPTLPPKPAACADNMDLERLFTAGVDAPPCALFRGTSTACAAIRKGIDEYFRDLAADVVMLQAPNAEEQLPKIGAGRIVDGIASSG